MLVWNSVMMHAVDGEKLSMPSARSDAASDEQTCATSD